VSKLVAFSLQNNPTESRASVRLRNIEDTEKAKRTVEDEKRAKQTGRDEDGHLAATRCKYVTLSGWCWN